MSAFLNSKFMMIEGSFHSLDETKFSGVPKLYAYCTDIIGLWSEYDIVLGLL